MSDFARLLPNGIETLRDSRDGFLGYHEEWQCNGTYSEQVARVEAHVADLAKEMMPDKTRAQTRARHIEIENFGTYSHTVQEAEMLICCANLLVPAISQSKFKLLDPASKVKPAVSVKLIPSRLPVCMKCREPFEEICPFGEEKVHRLGDDCGLGDMMFELEESDTEEVRLRLDTVVASTDRKGRFVRRVRDVMGRRMAG